VGRRTKLTAEQHEQIRSSPHERAFLAKRIAADKRRMRELSGPAMARRFSVCLTTIRRVMSGDPYVNVADESIFTDCKE
jgi:hypothetical protein